MSIRVLTLNKNIAPVNNFSVIYPIVNGMNGFDRFMFSSWRCFMRYYVIISCSKIFNKIVTGSLYISAVGLPVDGIKVSSSDVLLGWPMGRADTRRSTSKRTVGQTRTGLGRFYLTFKGNKFHLENVKIKWVFHSNSLSLLVEMYAIPSSFDRVRACLKQIDVMQNNCL